MSKASRCFLPSELDLIMNTVQAGIVVHDNDTSILFCNGAAQTILGLSEDEMLGKAAADPQWHFFDERGERLPVEEYPINRVLRDNQEIRDLTCGVNRPKTGDKAWLQLNATPVMDGEKIRHVTISFLDVTAQVANRELLEQSRKTFQKIYDKTPMGMCTTDERGYFESINPAYLELYGYEEEEILGKHFTMVVPSEHRQALSDLHDKFIQDGAEIRGNWDVVDKSGTLKSVLADAAHITGNDGRPKKVTFVMDVTRERQYERQLEKMALTDSLTGLFNRRHFYTEIERELARSLRYGDAFSVAMLDIDHFKRINDTHGHNIGDAVLEQISRLMLKTFRELDVVCRYGGEEFIVLMPNTERTKAKAAAERLRRSVESEDFPEGINVTVSGGVGQYEEGTIDDFIKTVDALLYNAKELGRNRIEQ